MRTIQHVEHSTSETPRRQRASAQDLRGIGGCQRPREVPSDAAESASWQACVCVCVCVRERESLILGALVAYIYNVFVLFKI